MDIFDPTFDVWRRLEEGSGISSKLSVIENTRVRIRDENAGEWYNAAESDGVFCHFVCLHCAWKKGEIFAFPIQIALDHGNCFLAPSDGKFRFPNDVQTLIWYDFQLQYLLSKTELSGDQFNVFYYFVGSFCVITQVMFIELQNRRLDVVTEYLNFRAEKGIVSLFSFFRRPKLAERW